MLTNEPDIGPGLWSLISLAGLVSDDRRKYGNIDISSQPRASWIRTRVPRPSVASDIPSQTISWHGEIFPSDFQHCLDIFIIDTEPYVKWPNGVTMKESTDLAKVLIERHHPLLCLVIIKVIFQSKEEVTVSWYDPMLLSQGGTENTEMPPAGVRRMTERLSHSEKIIGSSKTETDTRGTPETNCLDSLTQFDAGHKECFTYQRTLIEVFRDLTCIYDSFDSDNLTPKTRS